MAKEKKNSDPGGISNSRPPEQITIALSTELQDQMGVGRRQLRRNYGA